MPQLLRDVHPPPRPSPTRGEGGSERPSPTRGRERATASADSPVALTDEPDRGIRFPPPLWGARVGGQLSEDCRKNRVDVLRIGSVAALWRDWGPTRPGSLASV